MENEVKNIKSMMITNPDPPSDYFDTMALDEGKDSKNKTEQENNELFPVINYVKSRFNRAKTRRQQDEERWLQSYNNYRGVYGPDTQFTDTEKSRVFIKITKTKVLAAYSQITEVLFAGSKFPIGVEASKVPTDALDAVNIDAQPKPDKAQEEQRSSPAIARPSLKKLGSLEKDLKKAEDKVEEGVGKTPSSATFEPAKQSAWEMQKKIEDQLEDCHADKILRNTVFEQCLFGTGILKGPFLTQKEYSKWSETGEYSPKFEDVPVITHVPLWSFYPDPDARSSSECEYVIERHRMSRSELRQLKERPNFRENSIELAIEYGENYIPEWWENQIEDFQAHDDIERFEVLEYWGVIDHEIAETADIEIPKPLKDFKQFEVNIWVCNNQILRFTFNPFKPSRIPYLAVPYELNPYSFFGVGVAENMEDTQLLMNGFMRLAVDNAALSSNILIEVDESSLAPDQDFDVYPGKVFRRNSGAPGQAIFGTKFPNITNEIFQAFDKVRQLADESTGMPSYAHGQTGVQGVGRTAAGISMLMGAAAQNIKAVVRNIDDYLLNPLGKALFNFNMQFNFDKKFTEGDLEVVARGTESLMRNEIRSQKLMQLVQVASNPMMAQLIKWDYVLREIAKTLDLDPEKVLNDPRSAIVQASVMGQLQQTANPQQPGQNPNSPPSPQGAQGGPPPVSDPTGSGNGNIGAGGAPMPGEAGFSGEQG